MNRWWKYFILSTVALILLLVIAVAFNLSYDALHHLALDKGMRPSKAKQFPIVIDGVMVVAVLVAMTANWLRRTPTRSTVVVRSTLESQLGTSYFRSECSQASTHRPTLPSQ
jgi:hypothetical protein